MHRADSCRATIDGVLRFECTKMKVQLLRPGRLSRQLLFALILGLLAQTISATDELPPDIALLEFLGTIAGLEGMGVEIDQLLAGAAINESVADTVSDVVTDAMDTEIDAEATEAGTSEVVDVNKGDSDDG